MFSENVQTMGGGYLIGVLSDIYEYEDVAASMQTGLPRVRFRENSAFVLSFSEYLHLLS